MKWKERFGGGVKIKLLGKGWRVDQNEIRCPKESWRDGSMVKASTILAESWVFIGSATRCNSTSRRSDVLFWPSQTQETEAG